MKLDRVILFVKDIDVMSAFYKDVFCLAVVKEASSADFVVLSSGGAELALHAIPKSIAKNITIGNPPRAREEAPAKLVYTVADVAAERARLLSLGVFMNDPWPWGACDGRDPEGNIFQLRPETP